MDPKLLAMLGLNAGATLPEVLAAIEGLKAKQSNATESILLSVTGKASGAEAIGVVHAWKSGSEAAEKLAARVQELEGATKRAEVKAMLDAAVKGGKVAPAQVALLTQMGEANVEQLKAFLDAAPVLLPKGVQEPKGADDVASLTAEDRKVAALMNVDPDKLAKLVKAERRQVQVGEMEVQADA
jgi:phage I-like protein